MLFKFKNKKRWATNNGFTLIELLVVFSVSALIATVMIASYPDFTSKVEFDNVALDIALTIREAQVYGMGSVADEGNFDIPYGVNFDMNSKNSFIFFADKDKNNKYNSPPDKTIDTLTIKSDFIIEDICINGDSKCYASTGTQNPLNITFKRPNPDGIIRLGANSPANSGSIKIKNTKTGKTKTITVTNTGQISIQ